MAPDRASIAARPGPAPRTRTVSFSRHAPWLKDELGLDSGLGCYHELGNYYAETCGCSLADKAGRYGCPDQSALAADKKKKGGGKKKMKKNGEKKG
ncbi:hypothetical protein TYRP_019755 [Tyrophagus putrescentiae]|nr:hypothetical protein TYRP_019755 [Tyrophagus putrescentiae]